MPDEVMVARSGRAASNTRVGNFKFVEIAGFILFQSRRGEGEGTRPVAVEQEGHRRGATRC